uniref:Cytochrome P450 n=1 Tax=Oryza barthii TaxID=65489 RepID=A0A0D3ELB1_9ORYZ
MELSSSLAAVLHSPLFLLAALLLLLVFTLLSFSSAKKPGDGGGRRLPLPPSPRGVPFLGHLPLLGSLPHRKLRSMAEAHGPVMLLWFGRVPTVVASSAAAAQEAMRARDAAFASRARMRMAERLIYGRDMVFAPYGEFWRQARRVSVLHLLSPRRIASFRGVREQDVAALLDRVRRRCCRVIADHRERRRLSQPDGGDGDGDGDENVDHRDFVDVLLDVSEVEEGAGAGEVLLFDTVAIKAIILDMIAAATDTTFTTLEWAMAELINHPPVMRKLQCEIRAAVGVPGASGGAEDFRFVPFGAGRRGCPGAGFAAPSIELALTNLLYHFDWELPPHADGAAAATAARLDMGELFGLSMRMKTTLNLVAKPCDMHA